LENYQGKRVARGRRTALLLIAAAVVMTAAAAVLIYQKYWDKTPPSEPDSSSPAESASQSASGREPAPGASLDLTPEPKAPVYDFSQPAPEGNTVDNSYFDDAAFVGDSRTDGFMLYSGIGTGENLTSNGLSTFRLAEKKALTINGEKYTLLEALALKEYGKVYLSLGINELGYGSKNDNSFYSSYCAAIDEIRRLQPDAVIYIQGLIPLNEKQIEEYNGNKYNLTNDHLRTFNELLRQAAEEKQVVYLDLYTEFADESGALPEEDSRDGVHLKREPCKRWLDYLKTHTVDFNALYPDGPPMPEPAEPATDITAADGSGQG